MGLFSNRVSREDLQAGDHIYSWRFAYSYAHHGIYIGDDSVIHFTRGQGEETGTGTFLDKMFSSSLSPSQNSGPCEKCGVNMDSSGVMLTCLDCFLCGCPLYRFQYDENPLIFFAKARGGMCTLAISDPSEAVLHRSRYLLGNGFGCYHIFRNNCEDFAMYCKTGLLVMERRAIGRSGQAISFLGAPLAFVFSSPLRFVMTQAWGSVVMTAGMYCLSRYAADMGVRKDVAKVAVEDLVVMLGPPIPKIQAETQCDSVNCNGLEPEVGVGQLPKIQAEETQCDSVNCNGLEPEVGVGQEIGLQPS